MSRLISREIEEIEKKELTIYSITGNNILTVNWNSVKLHRVASLELKLILIKYVNVQDHRVLV
jgi:hypothetical protein